MKKPMAKIGAVALAALACFGTATALAGSINLSEVTANTTVADGTTLTGKLGEYVKISIADGATVTLDGVTIDGYNNDALNWAGITCEGDATIILAGANTVKGFYESYPGIFVPSGKTLTIKGDGSLDAFSNGYGAGIGGGSWISCGNIVIEGGTITATGGDYAAGIGGGSGGSCGDITITGGTITATGGRCAPGIGGGDVGSCGTITIADTVTNVTATKGKNAPCSIGKGNGGSCGTVKIGGTEYASGIAESPYTYVPPAPATYTATLKDGTEDAANWTITPNEGLSESNTVTVAYAGTNTVKSVKAVKPLTLAAATAADIGKVVCAAGHLHDAKTAVPDGCTAVGIIGKVTETGHGLILALQDATAQNWNTINGWTSETGYAGTTLKVLPDDAARGANLTSYTALGNTAVSDWAVAQKSDYDAIFTNLGSTTGDEDGKVYDANVNDYITGVGGAAISGYYWSATENGGNAWKMESSYWVDYGYKPTSNSIRPVLGFKSGATEEVGEITVTSVEGKTNKWTFQMPAADVVVEVEYFTQEEVDSIAAAKAAIEEIGEVDGTEESKEKVAAARKAYDALTDDLKEFVENYGLLPFAEAKVDAFGEIDTLAETNTSALATELIAAAREAVAAVEYDEEKTPDENMDALELASNGILEELGAALDSIHTVSFAEGTPDAENWTIAPYADGKFAESNTVTAAYSGTNKVKSVKATMKAAAGVTAYTLAESTVGMIVGTDGNAYAAADKDNLPSGVTAAGMVAYKSGSNGLVIALADEASTMDWSTATGASGAAAHTPTITGQTWKLPTQDEWKQMLRANGGDENSYTGLNSALATAGGDSSKLQTHADYWSLSEHIDDSGSGSDGSDSVYARELYLGSSAFWFNENKINGYRVRACLAFSGDATDEVDDTTGEVGDTTGEVTEEIEITVTPVEGKTNEWTFQMPDGDVKVEVAYLAVATFEVDGETYAVITNVVGKAVETPAEDPVKAGHTFAGWFTEATGGTQITDETLMGIADTTFYAQFRAPILTIENGVLTAIDLNGCTDVQLEIPGTVTTIGESAFYQCTGLASVTIPGSVKTISHAAFRDCSNLTSVTIEEGATTIGERAFARCVNLASITIPGTVTEIGEAAFSDCKSLASLTIPGSVKTIGPQAFQNCTGLESVTIEEGVETIGRVAFDGCENLSSVTIPDSVKEIGDDAFAGCSDALYEEGSGNLAGVKLVDGWAVGYDAGSISENLDLTGVRGIAGGAFAGCDVITSVIIPDGVATIPEYVFNGCDNLTGVTIPDSVTSIGEGAFGGCDNFASVTIPDSVTSIGKDAFEGCSEELFDTTTIPGVALVDGWAVGYTDALPENLDLTGARGIADNAFRESKLESVTIPGTVARVPAGAFMSCSSLASVTLEEGVTAIDDSAFIECSALESVEIPDTVTAIGPQAFVSCAKLASVTVPGSVAEIGSAAFGMCPTLTNVTLEAGVTNIGMMAFAMCSALESLEIPDTVTAIGAQAFMMSMNFASVTIPSSVKEIGQDAFLYTALATVNVDYGDGERVKALLAASGVDVSNLTFVEPYKLTFDPNGGAFAEGVETNRFLYAGAELGELPEATRTGYTFAGWLDENDNEVTATSKMGDADATVYAQWTINQYTITFDSDGGSDVAAITNDYGFAVTAPADPAKTGYTFAGWTPAVPETIPASNTVCTAGWTINQYTISFDANGGEGEFDPATLDYGSEYGELPEATRTGYTFKGWADGDGNAVTAETVLGAADVTLKAQWTINQYTIAFDSNGGSDVASITGDYGTEVTAPEDPAKTGYTFKGWTPALPETVPASNSTHVAQWTVNQYSITFDVAGGEGELDPVSLDYGASYGELPEATRTGYTFKGWTDGDGNAVTAETVLGAADVELKAQWEINQYTVKFVVEGETYAEITADYGAEVAAPADPDRGSMYRFLGWDAEVPATVPAEDVTLTALWKLMQIDVPAVVGGDTNTTVNVTVGEKYTDAVIDEITKAAQATAERHGQIVAGWTNGDGSEVTGDTIVSTNDVLSAVWENVNPLVPETLGEGAVDTTRSQKFEAYVLDADGDMRGTVVVTVGKANKKSGLSSVKAQVKLVGETKTYTFKATEAKGGKAAISTEAATEGVELYNKNLGTMVLDIGAEGVTGTLGEYEINGSRNVYKTDKAAYAAWEGLWSAAIADADGAYSTFSVKVKKNGSVSVKGVEADGAKFSVTTRLMVADDGREACVAVKGNKKVPVGFTLWLGLDEAGAARATGVESASGDALEGGEAVAGAAGIPDDAVWTLSVGGEQVATLEWNGRKFSRDKATSARVTYSKSTGVFTGSYKAETATAKGRTRKTTVRFSGVFVDGVGYGTVVKGAEPAPVVLVPAK